MFHTNAATTAASTVGIVTTFVSTRPLPIVEANAQQIDLEVVSLALNLLYLFIHLARGRRVGALAQLFYHRHDCFRRLIEELDLFAKIAAMQVLRTDQDALANLLHGLRYLIQGAGQSLNVFTFKRCDEDFAKLLGQLLCDFLVLAPAQDELFKALWRLVLFESFQQRDEVMHARVCLLRALLQ